MNFRLKWLKSYNKLKDQSTTVASHGNNKCNTKTITYQRNEYVAELTKRRAHGVCELCKKEICFIFNQRYFQNIAGFYFNIEIPFIHVLKRVQ